jgi:hypothetical protein
MCTVRLTQDWGNTNVGIAGFARSRCCPSWLAAAAVAAAVVAVVAAATTSSRQRGHLTVHLKARIYHDFIAVADGMGEWQSVP